VTQRHEDDKVEILSGVYEGKTTGTPIALLIRNVDQRSKDYDKIAKSFRPGHADYTYLRKYGIRDPRGGGRSSARLTAPAVAAGAVAKKWLKERHGIVVRGYLSQLGPNRVDFKSWEDVSAEGNPFFVADRARVPELEQYMDKLRKSGESVRRAPHGRRVRRSFGLGRAALRALDADIAQAMMGINAVKGVEIGAGFRSVEQLGTEHSDEMTPDGSSRTTRAGFSAGFRRGRTSSCRSRSSRRHRFACRGKRSTSRAIPTTIETHGRHDPCVGIRATPIAEAFLALVLIDHALRQRAQNADVVAGVGAIPSKTDRAAASEGQKLEDPDPLEA
jgi:chorismate synthase